MSDGRPETRRTAQERPPGPAQEGQPDRDTPLLRMGIVGLDDVLAGGLPPRRLYLVQGNPGSGKTTLALQFLLEGARLGERTLFISLSETREELDAVARSHGWNLEQIHLLHVSSDAASDETETTLYHPSEVELGERVRLLLEDIDRIRPDRIVLDSCSELRLLAQGPLRYRRQVLALKARLVSLGSTILLLDTPQRSSPDTILESVVHGVFELEQLAPTYGAERRRLRVLKLRGRRYRGGYHDFVMRPGGLIVFPRLVAAEHHTPFRSEPVASDQPGLDALLGGGPHRGTSMLLLGAAGSGKSTVAAQYTLAAARRGESAAVFSFDESSEMFRARARSLGMDFEPHLDSGRVHLRQVDPAEISPGEFVHDIRRATEQDGARLVVIDSLNGYLNAMPEERFLTLQLHELLSYLAQRGVLTIMTLVQHGLVEAEGDSSLEVSYLADAVVLFRHFEAEGRVRRSLAAVKKRTGLHERTIRELILSDGGVEVGPVLEQFSGILTGTPRWLGGAPPAP